MTEVINFDTKKALIKNQACFSPLTETEIDVLSSLFIEKEMPAGATIVKEGDPVDSVYLIVKGKAEVKRAIVKDNQIHHEHLATLDESDAIGLKETGFYSISGIRTATVIAMTDMFLLRLSVAAFHGFALAYSHVSEVMRTYADKEINIK